MNFSLLEARDLLFCGSEDGNINEFDLNTGELVFQKKDAPGCCINTTLVMQNNGSDCYLVTSSGQREYDLLCEDEQPASYSNFESQTDNTSEEPQQLKTYDHHLKLSKI